MSRTPSDQPATTYELRLLSRVAPEVPAFEKHKQLVREWAAMEGAWKLSGEPSPPGTDGDSSGATCKLTKYLPPRVRGYINYCVHLPQDGSGRNWSHSITLEFKPHQVAYRELLEVALPCLIRIFGARRAHIIDHQADERRSDAELQAKGYLTPGSNLRKVHSVWFADEEYCQGWFRLTCEETAQRLRSSGLAEKAECFAGGVYVVGSHEVLSIDAYEEMCTRFEEALTPKKAWWKFW
ncbi:hypothetical protein [Roseimicrobium sp. ORNL1]|uniref:hypothetical protein n=1 Tax=Roseimicrobium sp. ORNL1 TaxID=2711231 RepID=UPI0013E1D050|nr:hypothetical protein [Roseimicrobium sp. ORNL1]QIF02249.1 hypothetical protein G5S37_12160 [Roseimicrobium sp. ORNL1]